MAFFSHRAVFLPVVLAAALGIALPARAFDFFAPTQQEAPEMEAPADEGEKKEPPPASEPLTLDFGFSTSREAAESEAAAPDAVADEALVVEEVQAPVAIPLALDLTAPTDDLWTRIRNGFAMPNLMDSQTLSFQQYYQSHPEYLRRMVERSRLYLHHIVEALEKRNMPTEIALLPMVESAYNPLALSPARASGLWQFIPSTGRQYKLEQNWWRDERRDVLASTNAALDYLQYIYDLHGDWHLALASYNWGEGAVGRAIAKNAAQGLPTDFSSLNMPNETRQYVPKLQALKNIFSNPELMEQLALPAIPNTPYFHTLVVAMPMDVKRAAAFAGLSEQEFIALNPAHNRPLIQANTTLVLPADRVEAFKAALEAHEGPLTSWQTYALRSGEQLKDVAPRFGISLADLKRVNGLSAYRGKTYPGLTLLVPSADADATNSLDFSAAPVVREEERAERREVAKSELVRHTVKKGETLIAIARKYQVSVKELTTRNRISGRRIRPGMKLVVREAPMAVATKKAGRKKGSEPEATRVAQKMEREKTGGRGAKPKVVRHTVKQGDTLFSIARRYAVKVEDLRRWNRQAGDKVLKIGSNLTIRKDS
jgi:membrane-bound lytic murein transglycosylase D